MERLCSWLSRVGGADPLLDEVLDETQREFLLSYRLPEAEADSTPGGRQRSRNRQYILPERQPRNAAGSGGGSGANSAAGSGTLPSLPLLPEGSGCGCETPGRGCSEDAEADKDPALQEQLQAVSGLAGALRAGIKGCAAVMERSWHTAGACGLRLRFFLLHRPPLPVLQAACVFFVPVCLESEGVPPTHLPL